MVLTNPTIDVRPLVDSLIHQAGTSRASDLHLEPIGDGYEVRLRIDGLLLTNSRLSQEAGRAAVSRFMVLARLLTYRLDVPQEGRLDFEISGGSHDLRVSIMPTVHGLRCVVRLPADLTQSVVLDGLGFSDEVLAGLHRFARSDAGMLIITGPAGAGKTTTVYALLAHIVATQPGVSIVSLEDPVERKIAGVTQIEVSPFGSLTYETALRSILRQDPQVLAIGEIRDAATASLAVQAALSGHRLLTTFHASTPAGALARLLEMGIEPYQISSSVTLVQSQRLTRIKTATGYRGRTPIAQLIEMTDPLRQVILARGGAVAMERIYSRASSGRSLADAARHLLARQVTDAEEIARVMGPGWNDVESPESGTAGVV